MGKGNQGQGHVYLRGDIYWIKYHKDGKPFYESTGSWKKSAAIELLRKRLASPAAVKTGPVSIGELLDDYEAYAEVHNAKSYRRFGKVLTKKLREFWGDRKASKITSREIDDYIEKRLGEPKQRGGGEISNATVNRELYVLRRAFNLAKEATPPKVGFVPKFRMLPEDNIRKGFLDHAQYLALLEALPEELRLPLIIGYHTGARRSEVLGIRLDQIDLHDAEIRLYDTKKHKEGRWLPIYGEMGPAVAAQLEMTERDYPDCPWLIHRNGQKVIEMRPAWPDACEKVGLKGLLFHDLRRSGVRNMKRAGIDETVAMKISGHKTRAVFDRYNIIDGKDIKDAGKKLEEFLKGQA
jgi:integrase